MMSGESEQTVAEEVASSGKYRLVSRLGKGAMGSVFEVVHQALGTRHAMKLLHVHDTAAAAEYGKRLLREGRVVAGMKHENLGAVTDFGTTAAGTPYLVSDLHPGMDLKKLVKASGPLPISDVLEIARQLMAGLGFAHRSGVVHRDVKPDNLIFLPPDEGGRRVLKILDFGVAKILSDDLKKKVGATETAAGMLLGTPAFAAPEQLSAKPVDARTDLYASGATIFYLLTARAPFIGSDLHDLMRKQLIEPAPAPSAFRSEVTPALDAVVLKALEKAPDHRYQSAAQMRDALDAVRIDTTTAPLPAATPSAPRAALGPGGTGPLPIEWETPTTSSTSADHETLFQSSPVDKAIRAEVPGHLDPRRTVPMAHSSNSEPNERGPSSEIRSRRSVAIPSRARWTYLALLAVACVVLPLAVIGLLHVLGVDP
ncbi:MAG: protein kinase [Polyangiaceae bacterium]|nr:protein kinase [Polyangiaceae bacterium]